MGALKRRVAHMGPFILPLLRYGFLLTITHFKEECHGKGYR
jgi:hypothetical protein